MINERLDTASVFLRPENNSLMDGIMKSLGQIKNMRTVMVHLRKGVSNALSKTGGIKSGIWSSLRSVRCLDSTQALLMVIVRILHAADQECC